MKRLKVIACEVAFRELCFCAGQSSSIVDFTFMPRKLHIVGAEKRQVALQSEIDQVDEHKYDAILLAYGLCGGGVVGLKSKLPLVIPKARDCLSIFVGSKERYAGIKEEHPKAFYLTSGWLEREIVPESEKSPKTLTAYKSMIDEVIFIDTHVGSRDKYRQEVSEIAQSLEASESEIEGDNTLLLNFLDGNWNEDDFTIIAPNHQIIRADKQNIIGSEI